MTIWRILVVAPLVTGIMGNRQVDAQASSTIQFERGKSAATVKGSISGRDFHDYLVRASEGQELKVSLRTSSSATYFNLLPPAATKPFSLE